MKIDVSLNGVDLEKEKDFYLYQDDHSVRIVLRRPKPKARQRTFAEKCKLFFLGRWKELSSPVDPYPDFVTIENWTAGWRDSFLFGTKEFDLHLLYEEDLKE